MPEQISNKKIFVVIPAYNENATVQAVVNGLLQHPYHIILVDDGSTKRLNGLIVGVPVYLLRHRVNLGQGAALQTGIEFAVARGADYIITFDADGQHDPADIERSLLAMTAAGADIALGSRFLPDAVHNMSAGRKIILQLARYFNFLFTGLLLTDAHNGFRILNRNAAEKIRITENRMAHATEILSEIKKHDLRYLEVPVNISYTDYSRAKGQSIWNSFRILFDILLNKIFR